MSPEIEPGVNVLVLNFDYTPPNIVQGRRAIVLLLKEKAQYVSARVIRLRAYVAMPLSRTAKENPQKRLYTDETVIHANTAAVHAI